MSVPTDLNNRRSERTLALVMMPEVIHIVNGRRADVVFGFCICPLSLLIGESSERDGEFLKG